MTRSQLEHVIRAAGAIAEVETLIIIGSQAILGFDPDPPSELLVSMEVDLYPPADVEKSDLIDGSIGEDSIFHETFGYYAHGIGPETAVLPRTWASRLIELKNENTNQIAGLCLHPLDLAVSKLAAGREKDVAFVRSMLRHGMVDVDKLRILTEEIDEQTRLKIRPLIERM